MSVDLRNVLGHNFHTSNLSWWTFLSLANHNGWEPMGTLPSPDWTDEEIRRFFQEEDYSSNSGQVVTKEDALALAEALEASLPEVLATPNEPELPFEDMEMAFGRKVRRLVKFAAEDALPMGESGVTNEYAEELKELIAFCREGEFRIH